MLDLRQLQKPSRSENFFGSSLPNDVHLGKPHTHQNAAVESPSESTWRSRPRCTRCCCRSRWRRAGGWWCRSPWCPPLTSAFPGQPLPSSENFLGQCYLLDYPFIQHTGLLKRSFLPNCPCLYGPPTLRLLGALRMHLKNGPRVKPWAPKCWSLRGCWRRWRRWGWRWWRCRGPLARMSVPRKPPRYSAGPSEAPGVQKHPQCDTAAVLPWRCFCRLSRGRPVYSWHVFLHLARRISSYFVPVLLACWR